MGVDSEEIKRNLENIGLSSNESKIYITLLRLGEAKAGQISKKSHINRTTTYDLLDNLLKKGLIKYRVKNNVKWYECANPESLMEIVEEKRNCVKNILPFLKEVYTEPQNEHDVTLYHGRKGVKTVFRRLLDEAEKVCVMDSESQLVERMPLFADYVIKQLDERDIRVLYLVRKENYHNSPSESTEVRFIEKETPSNAVINIYDNKLIIFVWSHPPETVVIENQAAADSLRDYFYIIWEQSKKEREN